LALPPPLAGAFFWDDVLVAHERVVTCAREPLFGRAGPKTEGKMTPSSGIRPVYDTNTLRIMTNAFGRACNFLPVQFRNSDRMRRELALRIRATIHRAARGLVECIG
jgi:hypothetical protein